MGGATDVSRRTPPTAAKRGSDDSFAVHQRRKLRLTRRIRHRPITEKKPSTTSWFAPRAVSKPRPLMSSLHFSLRASFASASRPAEHSGA